MQVEFYEKNIKDSFKSMQNGYPVYIQKTYVRIQNPSDVYTMIDTPATQQHINLYREEYENFLKSKLPSKEEGEIPIEVLFDDPNIVLMLKSHDIRTVEKCASMSSIIMDKIGRESTSLRDHAKRYLEGVNNGAEYIKLQHERNQLSLKIKELERMIEHLQTKIQEYETLENGRKRGFE